MKYEKNDYCMVKPHSVVRIVYRYQESVCLLLRNRWNNFVKYMDH